MGPLTITAENMTDMEIDRILEDVKKANTELHIKDLNGKVIQTFTERKEDIEINSEASELELLSNLILTTETEQDTKENNLRRSKRLTKTNPIVRLNNTVLSDYRNYCHKAERSGVNDHPGIQPGIRQRSELLTNRNNWSVLEPKTDRTTTNDLTRTTANITKSYGRNTAIKKKTLPSLANSRPIAEGGVKNT